jgi:aconitate hydratase
MGVLPLQFINGVNRKTLNLDGTETLSVLGIEQGLKPQQELDLVITRKDSSVETVKILSRIDTAVEVDYYNNGGILHYVLRKLCK